MAARTFSVFFIVLILLASFSAPVFGQAQQTEQQKRAEKVKSKIKKLGLGERVKVSAKLYSDVTYKGYVSEANEDNFVIVDKTGNPNSIKYSDVKSVGGKNLSTGAKIAIGIGIGAGAVLLIIAALIASLD